MWRVLSRKNTTDRGTKFIYLFILKKNLINYILKIKKNLTKFKLYKVKVEL